MNIKTSILQICNASDPYMMPHDVLRTEIETRHRAPVGDAEYQAALKSLLSKGMIDYEVDQITLDKRYRITGPGKAYLNN
ncbi:hypothetical protein EGM51_10685 [Verrucomicrobia bacterium S94]|nr:hypothetical protein EGM51_10685 [Verrucomicrobia bacterium S94]